MNTREAVVIGRPALKNVIQNTQSQLDGLQLIDHALDEMQRQSTALVNTLRLYEEIIKDNNIDLEAEVKKRQPKNPMPPSNMVATPDMNGGQTYLPFEGNEPPNITPLSKKED